MNTTNKSDQIWESLRDPEFREQFIDEHISVGIAFQIHSLRNRQKLTQTKLAELLGGKQPLISEWENPSYGSYTLGTLKDLAKAFDVGLLVRFVPFSTLVDWTINLTSDVIAPPSFGEEEQCHVAVSALAAWVRMEDIKSMDANNPSLLNLDMPKTISYASTAQIGGELANVT